MKLRTNQFEWNLKSKEKKDALLCIINQDIPQVLREIYFMYN